MPSTSGVPITKSAIDAVLTNFYIPRMWEMIQVEAPGFRFFKNLDFVNWGEGYTGTFPVRIKAKRGMVGGTTGRLPKGGAPQYDMATINYTLFRCLINFTWDSKLISSNERYIKNLIDQAVTDCKNEYLRRFNTYLYTGRGPAHATNSGYNCVGVGVSAITADDTDPTTASGKLRIGLPWTDGSNAHLGTGGLWIEEGDYLRVVQAPGSNSNGEFIKVTDIDRSNYPNYALVGFEGTGSNNGLHLADTNVTAGDATEYYLASPAFIGGTGLTSGDTSTAATKGAAGELSDYGSKFMGLKDIVSGLNPGAWEVTGSNDVAVTDNGDNLGTNTGYLGVSDASFSNFKSLVKHNSGTSRPLSQELLDQLILEQNERSFVRPNLIAMNTGMWHEYVGMSGHANEHFYTNRDSIPIGHSPSASPQYFTVKATEAQGNIDILIDKYCPPKMLFAIDTQHVGYSEVHKMAEAAEDGSFLRMSSTDYDEWFGFLRWGGQFAATSPQAVAVLKDLDQDIVAL